MNFIEVLGEPIVKKMESLEVLEPMIRFLISNLDDQNPNYSQSIIPSKWLEAKIQNINNPSDAKIYELGQKTGEAKYGNLFQMYEKIVDDKINAVETRFNAANAVACLPPH